MAGSRCEHRSQIADVVPDSPDACPDCLALGDRWVHLRVCLVCGHVGCCDNSPNQHARRHFHETQHAIIQSYEPGEAWRYCYVDNLLLPPGRPFRP
ncbi:UBP-type zinc finger domain-containing protein [Devosia sp.]|uniref:UBP-type zinc finger domain-containing protein n=1 Tax=Devosia sp. TaxID=1871048 RepID=UPI002F0F74F7